ncbi:unnamed protein product, partial [Vitis vinifera]
MGEPTIPQKRKNNKFHKLLASSQCKTFFRSKTMIKLTKAADIISSSHSPLFILHSSSFINPTFFTLPMADAIVSIVLERLTSVVEQQIHEQVSLVPGVESEIQSLKNTLRSVRDVLEDAERRKVKENSVQGWLERLKDMAYEMMDVLDEWSIAIFQFQMEGVENASTSKTKAFDMSQGIGFEQQSVD